MNNILQFLKEHGDSLDIDIAEAVGMSLDKVHIHLSQLSDRGLVVSCHSIRFLDEIKIEGMRYRVAGVLVEAKRGRNGKRHPPDYWHNHKG